MYHIVTIAFEYRGLHSAQCSLAALRGKEAMQYALPHNALLLSDIHTGRDLYTELIKQAGVRPRTAYLPSQVRHSPLLASDEVASTT